MSRDLGATAEGTHTEPPGAPWGAHQFPLLILLPPSSPRLLGPPCEIPSAASLCAPSPSPSLSFPPLCSQRALWVWRSHRRNLEFVCPGLCPPSRGLSFPRVCSAHWRAGRGGEAPCGARRALQEALHDLGGARHRNHVRGGLFGQSDYRGEARLGDRSEPQASECQSPPP